MVQVSEDIFYQVKKEILDKLDVILQKVNLEIINYLHPQEDSFSFIELSSFENQLTHLFHYLDRLYASLNTSVSFSSINSFKSSVETYQVENQRLAMENNRLLSVIEDLKEKRNVDDMTFEKQMMPSQYNHSTFMYFEQLKLKTTQVMDDFKSFAKDIKKALKKYKFDLLESRVEIISKLKDFEAGRANQRRQSQQIENRIDGHHGEQDGEEIIQAINEILSLC